MATVKGPFTFQWGANPIVMVSEISNNYEQDTEDVDTLDGLRVSFDGPISTTVDVTILSNDIPVLAALLPQYHVANGETMSTGEVVNDPDGAIDVKAASCGGATVFEDLEIISCDNPGQVYRLVNARSRVSSVDFETNYRTVTITFVGQPESGVGVIQFFKAGTLNPAS